MKITLLILLTLIVGILELSLCIITMGIYVAIVEGELLVNVLMDKVKELIRKL